jgi:protein TonB
MIPPSDPFYVVPDERLLAPGARWTRVDRSFVIALSVAIALYAALLLALMYGDPLSHAVPPEPEEIPIEIVTAPPPPPPPPPPPAAAPKQETPPDEKPAFDSPRAGTDDKRDDATAADPAKPPSAPPPPSEAPPAPATAAPPPAPQMPTAAEGEAPEASAKAEPDAPSDKPTPEKPAPPQSKSAYNFDSVPEVDFGGAALKAPVAGGQARATYLTILHGLIVPRFHVPAMARTYGRRLKGELDFSVDGNGRLVNRWISQSSGSQDLDAAAMEAIAVAAAKFPAPPHGVGEGITWFFASQ